MRGGLRFSIVIPTRNRPEHVRGMLQAAAVLTTPRDCFEVILVNDGGEESLEPVVAPFREQLCVRLHEQENRGPGQARNSGAEMARGRWIAFTDDDCRPEPDWLERMEDALERPGRAAVAGRVINGARANLYAATNTLLLDYVFAYFERHVSTNRFFPTNNLCVPADMFRAAGGFDDSYRLCGGEDREFCFRWQQAGHELVYEPSAVVKHYHPQSFGQFCEMHFRYGRGAYYYHQGRARTKAEPMQLEGANFYLGMPAAARKQVPGWTGWQVVMLLALSQGMHTTGFFWESLLGGGKTVR